jgi:hypothetical protein
VFLLGRVVELLEAPDALSVQDPFELGSNRWVLTHLPDFSTKLCGCHRLSQQRFEDAKPFRIQRLPTNGLASPAVPVSGVALIAFLAMQIRVNSRSLDTLVRLGGFMRPFPIALAIPPQPGEGERESGWRLGRGEGSVESV